MTSCLGTGSTAMLESSRHVKSVDAGHCGGERHVRGQGGTVRGASRVRAGRPGAQHVARHVGGASRVSCRVWQSELTFLSSCKRRRQCDDFLCPEVTIFVTQATGLALSRGADTLVRRRSVMIRAEVQTLS